MKSTFTKTDTITKNAHAALLATRKARDRAKVIVHTLHNAVMLMERAIKCNDTPNNHNKFLADADRTAKLAAELAEIVRANLIPFVPAERLASSREFFAFSRKTRAFQIGNTIGAFRKLVYATMLTNICAEIDNPDLNECTTIDTASSFVANLESVISIIRLARIDIFNAQNKNAQSIC